MEKEERFLTWKRRKNSMINNNIINRKEEEEGVVEEEKKVLGYQNLSQNHLCPRMWAA